MNSDHFQNRMLHAFWPEFDRIERHLRIVEVPAGTVLLDAEQPFDRVWFPLSGMLSVLCSLPNGAEVQACAVGREGALGLVEALNGQEAPVAVTAPIGARLSSCSAEAFRQVHGDSERMRALTLAHAGNLVRGLIVEAACHALHGVDARLCRWLLQGDAQVEESCMKLTQETLAALLGVQRTTVTQILGALQAAGLVEMGRGRIRLLDRTGLRRRACACQPAGKSEPAPHTVPLDAFRAPAPARAGARLAEAMLAPAAQPGAQPRPEWLTPAGRGAWREPMRLG